MRRFLIQLHWSLSPGLDREAVLARFHAVVAGTSAPARVVFSRGAFAADDNDNEDRTQPFTDLLIEATDAREVWDGVRAMLGDTEIGLGLRRSAIVSCDAPASGSRPVRPSEQLLLHHFDPSVTQDVFR